MPNPHSWTAHIRTRLAFGEGRPRGCPRRRWRREVRRLRATLARVPAPVVRERWWRAWRARSPLVAPDVAAVAK
jgi:hypothetical protein